MINKRRRAHRWGQVAEYFAATALWLKGYRIVARRYKTPVGEVDLIAKRGDLVVFVEVKARASHQAALDSITLTAQRRIEAAANWWISQQRAAAKISWRFDVVTVVPRRWPRHYKDVW